MTRKATIVLLVVTASLYGCGPTRPSKYYQLRVATAVPPPKAQPAYPVTLLLGPLAASHLYRQDRLVYGTANEEMGTYEYQRWAMPPVEMMQEMLLRDLRLSGRYQGVHFFTSSAHGDFLLRGHLYDFKEISGATVLARLTMELELREIRSGATVWTYFYSHDEPADAKDVPHIVSALNRNAQRCSNEFSASLDQYFASHPVQPSPAEAGELRR